MPWYHFYFIISLILDGYLQLVDHLWVMIRVTSVQRFFLQCPCRIKYVFLNCQATVTPIPSLFRLIKVSQQCYLFAKKSLCHASMTNCFHNLRLNLLPVKVFLPFANSKVIYFLTRQNLHTVYHSVLLFTFQLNLP